MLSCRDRYKRRSVYDTAISSNSDYGLLGPGRSGGLTLRGMTSLVTRKRSKWKSETMPRNAVEVHWDRYVDKLWKFCNQHTRTA